MYGSQRALYDGCVMAFQTQLHPNTVPHLDRLLQHHLLAPGTNMKVDAMLDFDLPPLNAWRI